MFWYQTWHGDAASWSRVSCGIFLWEWNGVGVGWGGCLEGQGHSEGLYDQNMTFFYVFWTADSLATKLGLMIHHHKPECLVKELDYCIQGQGHNKGSKCQCLSRWYLPNCQAFVTKLGIAMHHHEPECHAKRFFRCFQGHTRTHVIKIWQFLLYLLNCCIM